MDFEQKNKRRAVRRKRNILAKTMRMSKQFHEKRIEHENSEPTKCPHCPRGKCHAPTPDDCYFA